MRHLVGVYRSVEIGLRVMCRFILVCGNRPVRHLVGVYWSVEIGRHLPVYIGLWKQACGALGRCILVC